MRGDVILSKNRNFAGRGWQSNLVRLLFFECRPRSRARRMSDVVGVQTFPRVVLKHQHTPLLCVCLRCSRKIPVGPLPISFLFFSPSSRTFLPDTILLIFCEFLVKKQNPPTASRLCAVAGGRVDLILGNEHLNGVTVKHYHNHVFCAHSLHLCPSLRIIADKMMNARS